MNYFLSCKTCHSKSSSRGKEEFKLCESCSTELDQLRSERTLVQTIQKGPYIFKVYQKENVFTVELGGSSSQHSALEQEFIFIKQAEEAILSWFDSFPFRMNG
jgi:hypothetical protein